MPVKPSEKEEEYFARMEYERRKTIEDEKVKKLAEEALQNPLLLTNLSVENEIDKEKKRLKKLHFMQCPKCGMKLIEIDYKGIKVDKCSECEGIWLDAGELEAVSKLEKTVMDKLFSVFKK
ncbi:MAG: hypothetical protein A3C43_09095 [Candidatus Schekmanbacteria bacterium RIFCSPHIGHO2_02_FULL_38_11]|uniref:Transcription factor zinc-finger domain-containing protein n=1 Tax=Candidatus Schekmanbacteria bacterium RIFCSPLOWO2_12_FULL_38_15 TaxID=1817883 RepID=A0A1F7SM97_9BACT|nr:MAG: hypothetical protein A2043_02110 [Candidatus Schekmanbacteria bacterium GWA2_38_9]OGL48672.1 MAG: hypothetical protein A3H37_04330 [Candidatus Schekmanbacteria bacterium RIFCSPLOWO2_02_FULL_38_14]OGL49175.1 MAG: hypothetical protein A3C43_09095 [Candidatus Schekmanbacteria bacterium RIFCSPHIGHO2_02_FULL_38_11]OGL54327.1 MAG: hypothetical protein A3G31_12015 [Candidatus Schekmanbacteria bacterium RIFCSPLOWO2_12_FULL_38_15]